MDWIVPVAIIAGLLYLVVDAIITGNSNHGGSGE